MSFGTKTGPRYWSVAVAGAFLLLGAGVIAAAQPLRVGGCYIQTQREKERENPRPFFVSTASVTDRMKVDGPYGTLRDRLHSWAGWTLWGNNAVDYKLVNGQGGETKRDKLVQGPLLAGPLSLKYVNANRVSSNHWGEWPGLLFATPVGTLNMWRTDVAGYPLPHPDQTYSLVHTGAFYPQVRVYPASASNYDACAWLPDNLQGDRMGDWDIDLVLTRPAARALGPARQTDPAGDGQLVAPVVLRQADPETIRLTMAQGSPFGWFRHSNWDPARGMCFVVKADGRLSNRTASYVDLTAEVASVDAALGCGLLEVKENTILGYDPLGALPPLTVYRYMAVFYDRNTTTATAVDTPTQKGLFLAPAPSLSTADPWYYVVAALPLVEYPGADSDAPSREDARLNAARWAAAIAPYAFNYVTGTQISYEVEHDRGTLLTTYTAATATHGPVGAAAGGQTALCLMPHHCEDFHDGQNRRVFVGDLDAVGLGPAGAGPFLNKMPATNRGYYPYWTVLGNLTPIRGTGFQSRYVLAHLLPFMPPVPLVKSDNPAVDTTGLLQVLNQMAAWDWVECLQKHPPANTQLNGGSQGGLYSIAGNLRRVSGVLPMLKVIRDCVDATPGTGVTSDFPANTLPKGSIAPEWGLLSDQTYDGKKAFDFNLAGIHDFFDLVSRETPTQLWGNGGTPTIGQVHSDSPAYFFYDGDLGALLCYPTNTALVCPSGCANTGTNPGGALFNIPQPVDVDGTVEDAFQLNTNFCDYHYNYGWMVMCASQGAWLAPLGNAHQDMFARDRFGSLVDQMIMTVVHDPDILARSDLAEDQRFWAVDGLQYPKMSFFDQWSGQCWVNGVPSAASTDAGAVGDWIGKEENSYGEAYQMLSAVALWGMATGRQAVADLGLYLATTSLYNYEAYWADHLQLRVPESAYRPSLPYAPGKAQWSARGDWIPSSNSEKAGSAVVWGKDQTFWSDWWYWGVSALTRSTALGKAAAWCTKLQQGQAIQQPEFGMGYPMPGVYNHWFPQGGHSLDFTRNANYQTGLVDMLNQDVPDHGWPGATGSNAGFFPYLSTVNQMRALLGLDTVYKDPRHSDQWAKSPWEWISGLAGDGDPGDRATLVSQYLDNRQSPVEMLNYFWALENYGAPDPTWFGYSKGVARDQRAGQCVVQPTGAVFFNSRTNLFTMVGFNPNDTPCSLNFWRVGQDATDSALSETDLQIPPHWFAVRVVPPPHH